MNNLFEAIGEDHRSNFCQCCLSGQNLQLMTQPIIYSNKVEVYYDMLIKCFTEKIVTKNDDTDSMLICEECVVKLRDCFTFRSQVECAQNKIKYRYDNKDQFDSLQYSEVYKVPVMIKHDDSDDFSSDANILFNAVTPENPNHIIKIDLVKKVITKEPGKIFLPKKRRTPLEKKIKSAISKIKSTQISDQLITENAIVENDKLGQDSLETNSSIEGNKLTNLHEKITKYLSSALESEVDPSAAKFVSPEPKKKRQRMSKEEFRRRCRIYFKKRRRDLKPFTIDETDNKCNVCDEEFYSHQSLVAHMNEHYPQYICDKCGKLFAVRSGLRAHIRIHEEGIPCEICNKKIMKRNLTKHVNAHLGKKDVHKCPVCNERFEKFSDRAVHMEKEHNIVKRYKCKWCGKVFNLAANLNLHVRDQHNPFVRMQVKSQGLLKKPRNSTFECEQCGKTFKQKLHLEHHQISKHSNEKNYQCHICERSYFLKYTLNQHMKDYHYETAKFSCNICDKVFKVKRIMTRHIKRVHNKHNALSQSEDNMVVEVKV